MTSRQTPAWHPVAGYSAILLLLIIGTTSWVHAMSPTRPDQTTSPTMSPGDDEEAQDIAAWQDMTHHPVKETRHCLHDNDWCDLKTPLTRPDQIMP